MAFTYVTITADYDLADGLDPSGTVTFTPTAAMINGGVVNYPAPVSRRIDVDGFLTISLAANTDPGTTPAGVTYKVVEQLNGTTRTYYVSIPHDQGSTLDLSTLASVSIPPALSLPSATIRGAADYSNTVAPTDGQVVTWDATAGKFKPSATIFTGSGAPTIAGTAGNFYLRTGTPSTANQRIYVCTTTGGAGVAVWTGIV